MQPSGHSNQDSDIELWKKGVTIGIPLYNEDLFIGIAIQSAAHQCETLLISDNCSTDKSEEICRRLAKTYPNISYVRHPKNMGAANNFEYLLKSAETEFFMWLGAHDCLPSNYVKMLRQRLQSDPMAIMSYGAVQNIDRNGENISFYNYFYTEQLIKEQSHLRLIAIIKNLHNCSLIHGIFVTEKLKAIWGDFNFLGGDHVLLAKASVIGKLLYEPKTFLYRRAVHLNDNPSNQLTRIRGVSQNVDIKKTQMQKELYILVCQEAKKLNKGGGYKTESHFWLASHFGYFSQKKSVAMLEILVWYFSIFYRVLKRNIERLILLTIR